MSSFGYKHHACGLILLLTAVGILALDVGGGSGRPLTPYDETKQESVANITEMYKIAGGFRMVRNIKIAGTAATRTAYRIGFEFLQPSEPPRSSSDRFLSGVDSSGKTITIDLARLENVKLLSSVNRNVRMSVTLFPDIAPEKLLALHPTYTALAKDYRTTSVVSVPCESADGRKLFLVGTTWSGVDKLSVAIPVSELKADEVIQVRDDFGPWLAGPWWAIQSVTQDPAYPFRQITKK